jgi:hypothetical protein
MAKNALDYVEDELKKLVVRAKDGVERAKHSGSGHMEATAEQRLYGYESSLRVVAEARRLFDRPRVS